MLASMPAYRNGAWVKTFFVVHSFAYHRDADTGEAFQYGVDFGLIAGIQAMVGFNKVSPPSTFCGDV